MSILKATTNENKKDVNFLQSRVEFLEDSTDQKILHDGIINKRPSRLLPLQLLL